MSSSWLDLTYANASKYCPISVESVKGHLTQSRQGVRSTRPKPRTDQEHVPREPMTQLQELFIRTEPISKLYTDDMGRLPIRFCRGNNFIMIAYHVDTNVMLVELFASRHNRHRLSAANRIMANLTKRGHGVDLQILDNECSAAYKLQIEEKWEAKIQLFPPDVYRRNIAERSIRTFKAHFLSILAGVSDTFPNFLRDCLLPQTELTLNLPRQSNISPSI